MTNATRLPEPHVIDGHYRDHTDKVCGYSVEQVMALIDEARSAGEHTVVQAVTDPENQPSQWGTVLAAPREWSDAWLIGRGEAAGEELAARGINPDGTVRIPSSEARRPNDPNQGPAESAKVAPDENALLRRALQDAEAGLVFAGADVEPAGDFVPTPTLALRAVRAALAAEPVKPQGPAALPPGFDRASLMDLADWLAEHDKTINPTPPRAGTMTSLAYAEAFIRAALAVKPPAQGGAT